MYDIIPSNIHSLFSAISSYEGVVRLLHPKETYQRTASLSQICLDISLRWDIKAEIIFGEFFFNSAKFTHCQ